MTDWQRDVQPYRICACGHPAGSHEIKDFDTTGRCNAVLQDCPCKGLRVARQIWTERRFITETVDQEAS